MTIQYTYATKMILTFDYQFNVDFTGSLDSAVAQVKFLMNEYGFTHADVSDNETGEVLIIVDE